MERLPSLLRRYVVHDVISSDVGVAEWIFETSYAIQVDKA